MPGVGGGSEQPALAVELEVSDVDPAPVQGRVQCSGLNQEFSCLHAAIYPPLGGRVAAQSGAIKRVDHPLDVKLRDGPGTAFAGTAHALHETMVGAGHLLDACDVERAAAKIANADALEAVLDGIDFAVQEYGMRVLLEPFLKRVGLEAVETKPHRLASQDDHAGMPGTMMVIVPRQVPDHLQQQVNPFLVGSHVIP